VLRAFDRVGAAMRGAAGAGAGAVDVDEGAGGVVERGAGAPGGCQRARV
jgi:hypothetical protein